MQLSYHLIVQRLAIQKRDRIYG